MVSHGLPIIGSAPHKQKECQMKYNLTLTLRDNYENILLESRLPDLDTEAVMAFEVGIALPNQRHLSERISNISIRVWPDCSESKSECKGL